MLWTRAILRLSSKEYNAFFQERLPYGSPKRTTIQKVVDAARWRHKPTECTLSPRHWVDMEMNTVNTLADDDDDGKENEKNEDGKAVKALRYMFNKPIVVNDTSTSIRLKSVDGWSIGPVLRVYGPAEMPTRATYDELLLSEDMRGRIQYSVNSTNYETYDEVDYFQVITTLFQTRDGKSHSHCLLV